MVGTTPPSRTEQPMPETNDVNTSNSPLSWRDVYRAVSESEMRIVAAINSAVSPINVSVLDHETRIRDLERHGSLSAQDAEAKLAELYHRVTILEKDESVLMAREKGVLATLSAGQKFVLLLAALASVVATTVHLVGDFASGTP